MVALPETTEVPASATLAAVADRCGGFALVGRVLLDRIGFAGEQSLVHEEVAGGQQHAVGRHEIAAAQA